MPDGNQLPSRDGAVGGSVHRRSHAPKGNPAPHLHRDVQHHPMLIHGMPSVRDLTDLLFRVKMQAGRVLPLGIWVIGIRVMEALDRLGLIVISGGLVVGAIITLYATTKTYPDCDNREARATLARLYDNRRLLHAAVVSGYYQLSESMTARYCTATVRWDNGLESQVEYQFYRSGRGNDSISMWIDYNGGMRGPSF